MTQKKSSQVESGDFHTQKMSIAEYRNQTGAGDQIKETPLSAQIAKLMDAMDLENDRIQSGRLYVVSKYTSKKTNKTKEHGRWIWMAKTGTPDRWCIIHKRFVLVEVKTKGKKPTVEQIQRQRQLKAAGAICINVDSLEDASQKLHQLKRDLDPKAKMERLRLELADLHTAMRMDQMEPETFANLIIRYVEMVNEQN